MYQIPKAGGKTGNYTDKTLLLITHDHDLNDYYPITFQIILEPRSPTGNESCWIRGSCKNIKHSFKVSGKFEIVCCLEPGEYTLKEVNFFRTRLGRKTKMKGSLKLNEKFKIGFGELVFLNKKFNIKGRLYTSTLSKTEKREIVSSLSLNPNLNTWKIKNQIGWESKGTFKEPFLNKTKVPSKIESIPNLQKVVQSDRPETIIVPVSSMGDVSDTRKQILENTLTDELKKHFRIVPQEKYEQVLEQVFEELEYEECSEDTCIMRVQEMLQVENVFNLQIIGEGKDSQLNLKWITLDEKMNETDYCEGCNTKKLNDKVRGLVDKLVGEKK